jgi:hypothetical protein
MDDDKLMECNAHKAKIDAAEALYRILNNGDSWCVHRIDRLCKIAVNDEDILKKNLASSILLALSEKGLKNVKKLLDKLYDEYEKM